MKEVLQRFNAIKFNILIETTYFKPHTDEFKDKGFKTNNIPLFGPDHVDDTIDEAYEMIIAEETNFIIKESGWSSASFDGILVRINKFYVLRGSTYLPLPKNIESKKAVINIKIMINIV